MIEFLKRRKIIIIIIVILTIIIFKNINSSTNEYSEIGQNEILVTQNNSTENLETEEEKKNMIIVHIAGEVKKTGIVEVQEGSRISDVIELAGGLTEKADIDNVNLAYVVNDGIKINIPSIDDETDVKQNYIVGDSGSNVIIGAQSSENKSVSKVNINKASQTELETLPGIGPSLAIRIIEYRDQNGKFKSIEEIKNVSGIGDIKYSNIENCISIK